jgi:hypothetical protein
MLKGTEGAIKIGQFREAYKKLDAINRTKTNKPIQKHDTEN